MKVIKIILLAVVTVFTSLSAAQQPAAAQQPVAATQAVVKPVAEIVDTAETIAAAEATVRQRAARSHVQAIEYVQEAISDIVLEYFRKKGLKFTNIKSFRTYLKTYRPAPGKDIRFLLVEFEELEKTLINEAADDMRDYLYLTREQIKNMVFRRLFQFLQKVYTNIR